MLPSGSVGRDSCGCFILAGVQGQAGWSPGQPCLMGGKPAYDKVVGTG